VFEHEEVQKDWTNWRTSQADWDDKDYYPKFIGPSTPRWCPSQENANELAKELHLEERREENIRKEKGLELPDEDNEDLAGMVAESDDEQTDNILLLPIKPTTLQKPPTAKPGSSNDKDRIPRQDSRLSRGDKVEESTRGRSRELSTRERELEFTRGRRRGDSKERESTLAKRERTRKTTTSTLVRSETTPKTSGSILARDEGTPETEISPVGSGGTRTMKSTLVVSEMTRETESTLVGSERTPTAMTSVPVTKVGPKGQARRKGRQSAQEFKGRVGSKTKTSILR